MITETLRKVLLKDSFKKFLRKLRKIKTELKEKNQSFQILEDIMLTLLPLNEDKIKMINQVIKIIAAANNITSNDLSSLLSSELFDDDHSKSNSENINTLQEIAKNKTIMLRSKTKLRRACLMKKSTSYREENKGKR
jgi:hypothetical protein